MYDMMFSQPVQHTLDSFFAFFITLFLPFASSRYVFQRMGIRRRLVVTWILRKSPLSWKLYPTEQTQENGQLTLLRYDDEASL